MVLVLGRENFLEPVPTAVFSVLSYLLAFCLIAFLPPLIINGFKKKNRQPKDKKIMKFTTLKTLGIDGWVTWTDIGLSVGGLVVYFIIGAVLLSIFSLFPWFNTEQTQKIIFNTNIYGFDRMLAFITLVVIAPIAEELVFRGYVYGRMREKFSQVTSRLASVIVSSLLVSILFGVVHLQWNVGVNVFALSLVACAMREYTGTIYAGILLHMIKNGLAFYYLFVLGIS
jgi:membrane protease YdiL (CAAX protease family)